MPAPWERQPTESAQAFRGFAAYRDLGPGRTATAAYRETTGKQQVKKAASWWYGWEQKFQWKNRAAAWDAELDRQARQVQIDAVREMNESHYNVARVLIEKVTERLEALDSSELTPQDVARWYEVAVKVQRLVRGEATERVDLIERVRQLAREADLDASEEAQAVAEAERIVRRGAAKGKPFR